MYICICLSAIAPPQVAFGPPISAAGKRPSAVFTINLNFEDASL